MRRSLQMGQLAQLALLLYTVGVSGGDTEHSLKPTEAPQRGWDTRTCRPPQ
jgi:hypothetical protein